MRTVRLVAATWAVAFGAGASAAPDDPAPPGWPVPPATEEHEAAAGSEARTRRGFGLAVGAPTAWISGDTRYLIGHAAPYGFESELTFPLRTALAGLRGEVAWGGARTRVVASLAWQRNLGRRSGTLVDTDSIGIDADVRLVGAPNDGVDIYSESPVSLDATVVDGRAAFAFDATPAVEWTFFAGYLSERFHFVARDTQQVGLGPYAPYFTGFLAGETLDYRVSYGLPCFGLAGRATFGKWAALGEAWISEAAHASDRDDHLARQKLSTSSTRGSAYQLSAGVRWNATASDAVDVGASYLSIRTSGVQHQWFYAGPDAGTTYDSDVLVSSRRAAYSIAYRRAF